MSTDRDTPAGQLARINGLGRTWERRNITGGNYVLEKEDFLWLCSLARQGVRSSSSLEGTTAPATNLRMPPRNTSPALLEELDRKADEAERAAGRIAIDLVGRLSTQRDILFNALEQVVVRYGYGPKRARPDYCTAIRSDEFDVLTRAYEVVKEQREAPVVPSSDPTQSEKP